MNIYKDIFNASPCDKCHNYNKCGDGLLACSDFLAYVGYGDIVEKNRTPSEILYNRIYGNEKRTVRAAEKKLTKKKKLKVKRSIPLWSQSSGATRPDANPPLISNLAVLSASRGRCKEAGAC